VNQLPFLQVTVFGEDAGAASITVLTVSPLAEGLFQKAIILSGNAMSAQFIQVINIKSN